MQKERRRQNRYPVSALAKIKVRHDGNLTLVGSTVNDICLSGMRISSVVLLEEGDPVSVELLEILGTEYEAKVKGTVAWTSLKESFCDMGISFEKEMSSDNQPALYEKLFRDIQA